MTTTTTPSTADNALEVYRILDSLTDANRQCSPGRVYLGQRLGRSPRQVARYINLLENIGAIAVGRRFEPETGRPLASLYTLTYEEVTP